jgi:hypothetical protein
LVEGLEEGGPVGVAGLAGCGEEVAVVEKAGGLEGTGVVEGVDAADVGIETLHGGGGVGVEGLEFQGLQLLGEGGLEGGGGVEGSDVRRESGGEPESGAGEGDGGESVGKRAQARGVGEVGEEEQEGGREEGIALVGKAFTLLEIGKQAAEGGKEEEASLGIAGRRSGGRGNGGLAGV